MKCPICKTRKIELDLHSDGFCQGMRECMSCGVIWTFTKNGLEIVRQPNVAIAEAEIELKKLITTKFNCPTCGGFNSYETELSSFQFHEQQFECVTCETVCSLSHGKVDVISDSQRGSFLATSTVDLL